MKDDGMSDSAIQPLGVEDERTVFFKTLRNFNEIFNDSVKNGGDECEDYDIFKSLQTVSNLFPLENSPQRYFFVLLGNLTFPCDDKWKLNVESINPSYFSSLSYSYKKYNSEPLEEKVPFLTSKSYLEEILNIAKEECKIKYNNLCFALPLIRAKKNINGISHVTDKLSITHYTSTFTADIKNIDEDNKKLSIDLSHYSLTNKGVLNKYNALKSISYDMEDLKTCNNVLKRLNKKLSDSVARF